jgi:DNA repair protein RecO (recombination protein O)
MHWTDEALILDLAKYGDNAAIVHVFARAHGRYNGVSRAAMSSRQRASYQPGNLVEAQWKARLEAHMGNITCEPVQSLSALVMHDALRLSAMASLCALLKAMLAERDPHPALYDCARQLALEIAHAEPDVWPATYARFELQLLQECGVGLDLTLCAATGGQEDLVYVSPKSGRAVSAGAGEPYRERLLALPAFLRDAGARAGRAEVLQALALTGFFLERDWFGVHHQTAPQARGRLLALLSRGE